MAKKFKPNRPADDGWEVADYLLWLLNGEGIFSEVAGSLRRGRPTIHDIDMVVRAPIPIVKEVLDANLTVVHIAEGSQQLEVEIEGIQVDFYKSTEEAWGAAMMAWTGSKLFNILIRSAAKKSNYKLNQHGLWFGEDMIAGRTEESIFQVIGVEYVPPSSRTPELHNNKILKWR